MGGNQLSKRDLYFFVSFLAGALVVYVMENRLDIFPPVLIGVLAVFIISVIRKRKLQKNGVPDRDERTDAVSQKVMLGSLLWSYLLLGVGLLIWIGLGYDYIKSSYIIIYIGMVIFITAFLINMAKKRA